MIASRGLRGASLALALLAARAQASRQDSIPDPTSYTIDAALDDHAHVLRAQERIEFRNTASAQLERLYLELLPNAFRDAHTAYAREVVRLPWALNPLEWIPWGSRRGFMTIGFVRVGGREAAFTVRETVMEVPLASPLGPGDALEMEIGFEVKLPVLQRALGFRGTNYVMGLWFPKLAVPDTAGWRGPEQPADYDFYADYGSYDVRITLPGDVVVAATGDLAEITLNPDGTATRRWRAEHVRSFGWVADRQYRVKRVTWNDVTVEYLYVGEDHPSIDSIIATTRAALNYYSSRYGPYLHRTLVIAEAKALGSGIGGIAHSRLIVMPVGLRRWPFSASLYQGALAHEIAHQWWGMAAGAREGRDAWLDEAMAEFAARDFERDRESRSARPPTERAGVAGRRAEYLYQAEAGFDRKILQPDSAFGDLEARAAAVYGKASFVLDMLQYLVGRDTLDAILHAFAERYRYRTARTADFVALAESVSGRDLKWFFDQWLDGTATCDYSIEGVATAARPGGGYRSVVTVRRNGGIVMPVEVEITLEDGTVLRRVWDGRERSHELVIDSAPRVQGAVLDPDGRLLETRRFNNFYSRKVGSSFRPLAPEDEAYHFVHAPWGFYDDGVVLGVLLAGGRMPRLIPPTWLGPQHLALARVGYNFGAKSVAGTLTYANSLGLLGRRAFWEVGVGRDRRRERAAVSARTVFGPHFWRAPFHVVSASLKHERRFEAGREFDQGTVRSVELGYTLRALVTDFYPIRGGVLAVDAEGGWKGLGSDWAFLRLAGQAEVYRRILGGTKLALNGFAGTIAAGSAPRQKLLFLAREANFRAGQFDTVAGPHLAAFNGELRVPWGTGTLFGVAGFVNLAKYWGSRPEAAQGLKREVGLGLRLFDNASLGVQLDVPFWTADGTSERLDFARLSLRVGRPFRGPGS